LVIGFSERLQTVTASNYSAIAHSTFYNTPEYALSLLSLLCLHRLPPGNAPNAVDHSASVFHGSCSRCLASISQDSALLRNGLQQWGLLRLPCLRQGRLFATASDESVSKLLTADSAITSQGLSLLIKLIRLSTNMPQYIRTHTV
jgi:hypothetical protein